MASGGQRILFYRLVDVMLRVTAYLISRHHGAHDWTLTFFTMVWPFDATRRLTGRDGVDMWFWIHVAQTIILALCCLLLVFNSELQA